VSSIAPPPTFVISARYATVVISSGLSGSQFCCSHRVPLPSQVEDLGQHFMLPNGANTKLQFPTVLPNYANYMRQIVLS